MNVNRTLPRGDDADSPTKFHHALRSNAEYRLLFADQLHRALFSSGALYVDPDHSQWDPEHPERNVPAARFVEIAESIDQALIAESARWGDVRDQLYTPDNQLLSLRNSLLTNWFPDRSQILLNQFRAQGLYPNLAAAEFNQHGGSIAAGFQLTAVAPQGIIYYTTDGSDPRTALTGEPSPGAQVLDGPLALSDSTHVKTRVLSGSTWSALNEATFLVQPPALTISEIHFNPAAPPEADSRNNDDFEFVELFNYGSETIDLAGVRLVDGVQFDFTGSNVTSLAAGQYTIVVKNLDAFTSRYDITRINIAGQYGGTGDQLSNSGERITLVDRFDQAIVDFKFKDGWHDLADGEGFSLTRTDAGDDRADLESRAAWRPSSDLGGSPGKADRRATPDFGAVIINELLTHTDDALGDRIELYNTTDTAIDLGGWLLSDDPLKLDKYVIPSPATIEPGGYLVFDQSQHFGNLAAAGVNEVFGFSELGERAILSAADASGLLGYRATRKFGAARREVSFGLHVKSTGGDDFVAMQTQTFGADNARPLVGPVVIHELRYRPEGGRLEFIELRNTSAAAVSLAGWSLSGVQFVFPPDATIDAGGLLVIAPVDPQSFRAAERIAFDVPILGPYLGSLNNGGEDVRLFMPGDVEPDGTSPLIQVDRVKYDNAQPWPLESAQQGASLQRIDPSAYGNDVANWVAGLYGGTPGDLPLKPIVINEILYRPLSALVEPAPAGNFEPTDEEYVELYNNSDLAVDVSGWKFTSGFGYVIPQGTVIAPRGYLVVASDVNMFTARYGTVDQLVGGDGSGNERTDWIGKLSNSGENIRFERPGGDLVDRVRYADSGDWGVRRWVQDFNGDAGVWGWQWFAPHDDLGHSLELMNPNLTNREGQNWAPSAAPLGTPGTANSVASSDIAPMLVDVMHSPAIPQSNEPVVVSARIVNEAESGVEVRLFYRIDPARPLDANTPTSPTPFVSLTMRDDLANNKDWPVDQPIYRVVLTSSQLQGLQSNVAGGPRSDEQYNATFIVRDPARGIDVDNGDLAAFNTDNRAVSIFFREALFVGGENIDAVHVRDNGNIILSTTSGATLGGLTFRDGDLIEYNPAEDTATLLISEDAFGNNVDIDAVWVNEQAGRISELIFSTDGTYVVGGDEFLNGDLVKVVIPGGVNLNETPLDSFDGLAVTRVLSETSLFVGGANIDGVHKDGGYFLISTTRSEQIGDFAFTNGSIVRVDADSSTAEIFFDESNFSDGNEDVNALFVDPSRDLLILSTDGDNAGLGTDTEVFYNVSIRIRGNGSREALPRNLRVSLPGDQLLGGQSVIPLNSQYSYSQLLGHTVFNEAGLSAEAPTKAVQVRLNSNNPAATDSVVNFGAYVQLQARDGNLVEANYPLDGGGNLYALDDRPAPAGSLTGPNDAHFRQTPDFDFKDRTGFPAGTPGVHDTGFTKQTNGSDDDWSDLPELARGLSTSLTPDSLGGDDLNFVHKVSQIINVNQWLRHMAVTGLIRNNEGGYARGGRGDDYGLYRGELDTRFELVPHDLDTTFEEPFEDLILGSTDSPFTGLFRVLEHPALRAIFAGHLEDLLDTVFNAEHLDPTIDELFGVGGSDWVSTNVITSIKNFIVDRGNNVRTRIRNDIENLGNPVSPNDLSQLPAEFQSLADQQRYLRISEIMYNPRGEELEFVELINMGDAPLDLTARRSPAADLSRSISSASAASASIRPPTTTASWSIRSAIPAR
ncbi:MAG: lamin tail domain-containing protein, partial [Planctomycetes bacterium]|nr:lamin tail domain-containing protein [Planctomycetota bacterium]